MEEILRKSPKLWMVSFYLFMVAGFLYIKPSVAFGANGIDSTSGSAQNLLATTKVLGAQDVNTIQSNAAMTAWGYSVQGMNNQSSSILDKWKADNINPAAVGTIAGAQSLLGSATQYAMAKNAAGNKQ